MRWMKWRAMSARPLLATSQDVMLSKIRVSSTRWMTWRAMSARPHRGDAAGRALPPRCGGGADGGKAIGRRARLRPLAVT